MAGFKTFTAGAILTAADINSYLMEQSIPVFADATARAAAITSPTKGMFYYQQDIDAYYIYTTSWQRFQTGWQSWTPTWTGVTKGTSPTETYSYFLHGKLCFAHGQITLGTAGAVTGSVTVTLPFASATTSISTTAGPAWFFDTSAGATFQGTVDIATNSTTATIRASDSSTTYLSRTNLSSTIPFGAAFAVGDRIGFNVVYQAA